MTNVFVSNIVKLVYMRPQIGLAREYIPSYGIHNPNSLMSFQRSRRLSSSFTRERRSNSKNQRFDMAVSNISNINANINSLLGIVRRDNYNDVAGNSEFERMLFQSRQKNHLYPSEKGSNRNSFAGVSPKNKSQSIHKIGTPAIVKSQFVNSKGNATIKYSNPSKQNNSFKQEKNLTRTSQINAKINKQTSSKQSPKITKKEGAQDQHEVSNWWEHLLDEVDEENKHNNVK